MKNVTREPQYSVNDIAEKLQVSEMTIRRRIESLQLKPSIVIGKYCSFGKRKTGLFSLKSVDKIKNSL